MSSVQAFATTMEEFLNELKDTFPEEKKINVYYNSFLTMKKVNPRVVVDGFMSEASKCAQKIMARDESYFLDSDDKFITDLNVKRWWTADLSSGTKDAIWQYMNTLLILGTTITSIPANMLTSLENVAEQCASQISDSGDSSGMLANMQAMLGGMLQNPK